jgi:hypothetical protein
VTLLIHWYSIDLIDQSNPDEPVIIHNKQGSDTVAVDHVVVAIGIHNNLFLLIPPQTTHKLSLANCRLSTGVRPTTKVAQLGGLELDETNHGIVVNTELAARSGICTFLFLLLYSFQKRVMCC